ncbi:MAG: hypothetical protein IJB29_04600 [Mailhella sp.]|nr:hypothetical protein [Mailhella sp.]
MNILNNLASRIGIFLMGVMLIAFGVALTAKASLGNSPISAIPYSLSLYLPVLTFGTWVILFNLLMIAVEWILLFGKISLVNIAIQAALTFTFGGVVDASMYALQFFEPDIYALKLFAVVAGCVIISVGALLELIANISVLPGDGLVMAISLVTGFDFGRVRLISDVTMSAIALAICLITLGNPAGVREGTLISAVLIGNIVRFFIKRYPVFRKQN